VPFSTYFPKKRMQQSHIKSNNKRQASLHCVVQQKLLTGRQTVNWGKHCLPKTNLPLLEAALLKRLLASAEKANHTKLK
jgi:hypothetical protein